MRLRSLAVRGLALLIAAAIFLLTGEAALRVFYRDGGERTLGGPGNRPFDHLTTGRDQLRGRRDVGPRRDGVPRLMILGDSITYGQGVHDWRNTWPELLVSTLERRWIPDFVTVTSFEASALEMIGKLAPRLARGYIAAFDDEEHLLTAVRLGCQQIDLPLRTGSADAVEMAHVNGMRVTGWLGNTPEEIETLAKMEHQRFVDERLEQGWQAGPVKDVEKKLSPHLVSWEEMDEPARELDCNAVRNLPVLLSKVGFKIQRR